MEKQGDGVAFFQNMTRCLPALQQVRVTEIDEADWSRPFIVTSLVAADYPDGIVAVVDGSKTEIWG